MKLIFVYNADSGTLNALVHVVHIAVSPNTYECQLCAITYDIVSENNVWRDYRKDSEHDMVFLHRDEFERDYASQLAIQSSLDELDYPIVLSERTKSGAINQLSLLIYSKKMSKIPSTAALIAKINFF